MSVINMTIGGTTDSDASFAVKVDNGPVRIAIADNSGMSSPTFFGPASVDPRGVAKVTTVGLDADARYWWRVEDNGSLDTSSTGQFRTHPVLGDPASYRFGAASCAGVSPTHQGVGSLLASHRISNHTAFDVIREKALAEDWLLFAHMGDLHYYDLDSGQHGITGGSSLANYRRAYDDVLAQPRQHALYSQLSWVYAWSNHDFSQGLAEGSAPGRDNACTAYRERVPHYALPAGSGANSIYHSFQISRHLYIVADVYSDRDNGVTMLGNAQKTWMDSLLGSTDAEFLIWIMPAHWLHPDDQTSWSAFPDERDEMLEMFGDHGFVSRMAIVSGDRHSIGIDSGNPSTSSLNPNGFPVYQCAPIAAGASTPNLGYDIAESAGKGQRYGSFFMYDDGTHIAFNGTVWTRDRPYAWYSFGL